MTANPRDQGVPGDASAPTVAVVVASLGRPELIGQVQAAMERQTAPPDFLLFSVTGPGDLPPGFEESARVHAIRSRKGLCAQRNAALDYLRGRFDLIAFYDDDFVPSRSSIANIRAFFAAHPGVAGATGRVIADGIRSSGITLQQAEALLEQDDARDFHPNCIVAATHGLYGCNMVYRTSAIGSQLFDERLRLYAWQEDVDFAASLRSKGRIVRTFAFAGVHQGVKSGRTSGLRLGYSQVINPCYLVRKGTLPWPTAVNLILRNLLANHVKLACPEPWVDRAGRARGNWIGLADLVRGRLTPERIEAL